MKKQTTSTPAPASTLSTAKRSLVGRGKLIRDLVAKGVDLKEFSDVVRESYPVCGDNWLAKHFKRAQARIAKKQETQKPAAAAPAPAPAPARKSRKVAAKA